MLGRHSNQLHFPKLVRVGEGKLIHTNISAADVDPIPLYKLDWEDHEKHVTSNIYPSQKYEEYIKSRVYALNSNYRKAIHYHSRQALDEWIGPWSFDTSVGDVCRGPAEEHVYVAFFLIADCNYDQETHWYSREPLKYLLSNMMIWSFWRNQTGNGLPFFFAKLDEKEKFLSRDDAEKKYGFERYQATIDYLKAVRKFEGAELQPHKK